MGGESGGQAIQLGIVFTVVVTAGDAERATNPSTPLALSWLPAVRHRPAFPGGVMWVVRAGDKLSSREVSLQWW